MKNVTKILFIGVAAALFAFPFGAVAGVKEGSDANFSWKIEWPNSVQKDKPFPIHVTATTSHAEGMYSTYLEQPPGSGAAPFCDGPYGINNCRGSNPCEHTYTCRFSSAEDRSFLMRISGGPTNDLSIKEIPFSVKICEGNICFENPLTSASFWQLFNRVMNFVLVVGLAIGPIVLLYGIFRFITAAGDAKKVSDAVNIIKYTLVGIVILLLARGILAVIIRVVLGA